jgi:hypothetical protein
MAEYELFIEKIGGELEVSLVREDAQGDMTQGTQKQRRGFVSGGKSRNEKIREAKESRRLEHARQIDLVGPHIPIIIRDLPGAANDTVIWKCNAAFIVDVEVDDGYKKDTGAPNPPRSPFVNTVTGQDFSVMPQAAQAVGGVFVVTGKVTKGTQAPDHMFYKMTIWSQGLKLDPDFFCDR